MTVPALALHPSPVSLVPRRGRIARHGWEPLRSPVTLRETAPSAFAPLPQAGLADVMTAKDRLFAHAGSTWAVLGDHGADGFVTLPTPDFMTFLRDGTHPDGALRDAFEQALRFTPLVPVSIEAGPHFKVRTRPADGAPWELEAQPGDRVVAEDRTRSPASLQAWLDANVALAGERVMVRRPLFAEPTDWAARKDIFLDTGFFPAPHGRIPVRPDRARAVCERMRYPYETEAEARLDAVEALASPLSGDDDIVRLANHFPVLLDADARAGSGTAAYRRAMRDPARAEAILDRLRPWVLRGGIAGVAREEAAEVLGLCISAVGDLRDCGVRLNGSFNRFVAQVEAEFMPRVADLAPEDEAALALAVR